MGKVPYFSWKIRGLVDKKAENTYTVSSEKLGVARFFQRRNAFGFMNKTHITGGYKGDESRQRNVR